MIPFQNIFSPGIPLCDQIVCVAKKAVVSSQMRPGDPFPSVRFLSKESTPTEINRRFVGSRNVSVTPMSLCAIFAAIARSSSGTA